MSNRRILPSQTERPLKSGSREKSERRPNHARDVDDAEICRGDHDGRFCLAGLREAAATVLRVVHSGEPRAALPLDGSPPIADLFHRTAGVAPRNARAQLNGWSSRKRLFVLPTWFGRRGQLAASGHSGGTATAIHAASLS
jgi:hypothetical protein